MIVTSPQQTLLRSSKQSAQLYVGGLEVPTTVFAATVTAPPTNSDMVLAVNYNTILTGAFANILTDMMVFVGTSEGDYSLGICRVRKAAISGTVYVAEVSDVDWSLVTHITVVDYMDLAPRHVKIISEVPYMDGDIAYTDQHENFAPVPIMGPDRIIDVVTYPVTIQFPNADDSYVFDSTITAKLWTATEGSLTGSTTYNPTLTVNAYPTNGRIRVGLRLTSAAGAQYTGYRYITFYDSEHPAPKVTALEACQTTRDAGGWSFTVTMDQGATLLDIRDNAPVCLFSRDRFGGTKGSIGTLADCAHMKAWGWIVEDSIEWDPYTSIVRFEVKCAAYMWSQIFGFPPGVELAVTDPSWTSIPGLTVDRAVWHLLHWRSTATRRLDIRLTGDDRISKRFAPSGGYIWDQIKEIAFKSIYAVPGFDRYGRFFLSVHPQLTPEADRTWDVTRELTKIDWHGMIGIRRHPLAQVAQLNSSGVSVDASGNYATYFSLSPGHIPKRVGRLEVQDKLLLSSQSQANTLCGLYVGMTNVAFEAEIQLAANDNFVDVFPNQKFDMSIGINDTARGITYDGSMIPEVVELVWDERKLDLSTNVKAVPETVADIAINGDIPGASDLYNSNLSYPPLKFTLPALPSFGFLDFPPNVVNPSWWKNAIIASSDFGLWFTQNFDAGPADVRWKAMNAGLTTFEANNVSHLEVSRDGHVYIRCRTVGGGPYATYWATLGSPWHPLKVLTSAEVSAGWAIQDLRADPYHNDRVAIGLTTPHTNRAEVWMGGSSGVAMTASLPGTTAIGPGANLAFIGQHLLVTSHLQPGDKIEAYKLSSAGALLSHLDTGYTTYNFSMGMGAGRNYALMTKADVATLFKVSDFGATVVDLTTLYSAPNPYSGTADMNSSAISPDGSVIIVSAQAGLHNSWKSVDGGVTWVTLGGSIPVGSTVWSSVGDNNRFMFGGGIIVRGTLDAGVTYEDKMGNLIYEASLININKMKPVY